VAALTRARQSMACFAEKAPGVEQLEVLGLKTVNSHSKAPDNKLKRVEEGHSHSHLRIEFLHCLIESKREGVFLWWLVVACLIDGLLENEVHRG
jgi:hypothetical protein